jgi:hypothetical protein
MRATLRRDHIGAAADGAGRAKAGSAGAFTAARFIGYYGLLGAAAVGAIFLR